MKPDHFDLPTWLPADWEEVKLYGKALINPNPTSTAATLATISTKKGIEAGTGQKMTSKEVADLLKYNQVETGEVVAESLDKHIAAPIAGFFANLKLALIVIVLLVIFVKLK